MMRSDAVPRCGCRPARREPLRGRRAKVCERGAITWCRLFYARSVWRCVWVSSGRRRSPIVRSCVVGVVQWLVGVDFIEVARAELVAREVAAGFEFADEAVCRAFGQVKADRDLAAAGCRAWRRWQRARGRDWSGTSRRSADRSTHATMSQGSIDMAFESCSLVSYIRFGAGCGSALPNGGLSLSRRRVPRTT